MHPGSFAPEELYPVHLQNIEFLFCPKWVALLFLLRYCANQC